LGRLDGRWITMQWVSCQRASHYVICGGGTNAA
jgi:hypothetical protein